MTTKKISEFDLTTAAQDADVIPLVREAEPTASLRNKIITFLNLKTQLGANFTDVTLTMAPRTVPANGNVFVDAAATGYVTGNIIQSGVKFFADGLDIKVISSDADNVVKVVYRNTSGVPVVLPIHTIKVRFLA